MSFFVSGTEPDQVRLASGVAELHKSTRRIHGGAVNDRKVAPARLSKLLLWAAEPIALERIVGVILRSYGAISVNYCFGL
jgi:hypothetical protein